MLDQILGCLPSAQILVAFPNRSVLAAPVVTVGHQNGDLSAEFGQLEWACRAVSGWWGRP